MPETSSPEYQAQFKPATQAQEISYLVDSTNFFPFHFLDGPRDWTRACEASALLWSCISSPPPKLAIWITNSDDLTVGGLQPSYPPPPHDPPQAHRFDISKALDGNPKPLQQ